MRIANSTALIGGGASGLGLATAERLIEDGANVVIADLSVELGDAAAQRLGSRARYVQTDITNPDDVMQALDVAESIGPLRIVVNCAGVGSSIRTVSKRGVFPGLRQSRISAGQQ